MRYTSYGTRLPVRSYPHSCRKKGLFFLGYKYAPAESAHTDSLSHQRPHYASLYIPGILVKILHSTHVPACLSINSCLGWLHASRLWYVPRSPGASFHHRCGIDLDLIYRHYYVPGIHGTGINASYSYALLDTAATSTATLFTQYPVRTGILQQQWQVITA